MSKACKWIAQLALGLCLSVWAYAQQEIKIGVIYPLTGSSASTGIELKNGVELAADIINNGAKNIPGLPFSKGGGLPNMKGAKIKLVFGDHQNNPQVAATEAERLITQEKVVALLGCYVSSTTATASQVAERYHIPMVNGDSTSPTLTERGFKYFFRVTPHDGLFVQNFFDFMKELQAKKNIKVTQLAALNENTLFGTDTSKIETKLAAANGYKLAASIFYPQKATQLTSEVQSLKAANPQVIMQASYISDAILSMRTYKELGYLPDMIWANDAGFIDTDYPKALGKDGDYVITREVWSPDLAGRKPLIKQINDLYESRYHVELTGNSARSFTAMMTLADAINRAGSTNPEAIRKALVETNIPGDKLIVPWKGIKFDATNQNTLGAGIIVQIINGEKRTIWPFDLASHDVVWPMPKWNQR